MIKKFKMFITENNNQDGYKLGKYSFYSDSSFGGRRDDIKNIFFIEFTEDDINYDGEIKIAYGVRGKDRYPYVDYIEWSADEVPNNTEEIELFVEEHLQDIINNAPKI